MARLNKAEYALLVVILRTGQVPATFSQNGALTSLI